MIKSAQAHPISMQFSLESALEPIMVAEEAWDSQEPNLITLAYTKHCIWWNDDECLKGRESINRFLAELLNPDRDFKLKKRLWTYADHHLCVNYEFEYLNQDKQRFHSYGHEKWVISEQGNAECVEARIRNVKVSSIASSIGLGSHKPIIPRLRVV